MNRETVGKKIREERLRCNLSLVELAGRLGTNAVKLSRVEHGMEYVSDAQMEALASVFGIPVSELSQPPDRLITYNTLHKIRRERKMSIWNKS